MSYPFQSTHLREVRQLTSQRSTLQICFNPRTCGRCDRSEVVINPSDEFQSTHLREVRRNNSYYLRSWSKFQSTHLREVRLAEEQRADMQSSFNPRTCGRCDECAVKMGFDGCVSIQAPAGGATFINRNNRYTVTFQPTHLREVRLIVGSQLSKDEKFQSTHLREVRLLSFPSSFVHLCFNPRTCGRCD